MPNPWELPPTPPTPDENDESRAHEEPEMEGMGPETPPPPEKKGALSRLIKWAKERDAKKAAEKAEKEKEAAEKKKTEAYEEYLKGEVQETAKIEAEKKRALTAEKRGAAMSADPEAKFRYEARSLGLTIDEYKGIDQKKYRGRDFVEEVDRIKLEREARGLESADSIANIANQAESEHKAAAASPTGPEKPAADKAAKHAVRLTAAEEKVLKEKGYRGKDLADEINRLLRIKEEDLEKLQGERGSKQAGQFGEFSAPKEGSAFRKQVKEAKERIEADMRQKAAEERRGKFNEKTERNFKKVGDIDPQTLAQIKDIVLNAPRIVIHGETIPEKIWAGDKKVEMDYGGMAYVRPDLDSKLAAYLFGEARTENGSLPFTEVRSVRKGAHIEGAINIDTGERPQSITLDDKGSLYIDHHGVTKERKTSASKISFDLLAKLGLMDKVIADKPWIKKLIDFSVEIDNMSYNITEKDYKENWWQTIYAVGGYLPFEKLLEFFEKGMDPRAPLPDEWKAIRVASSHGAGKTIGDICEEEKTKIFGGEINGKEIPGSIKGIEEAEKFMAKKAGRFFAGKKFDSYTPELGKFLINILPIDEKDKKSYIQNIPAQHALIAARALGGYNTVVTWNERNKSIKIESDMDLYPLFQRLEEYLPGIIMVRGTMIIDSPDYKSTQKRAKKMRKKLGHGLNMDKVLEIIFAYAESGKQKAPAENERKIAEKFGITDGELLKKVSNLPPRQLEALEKAVLPPHEFGPKTKTNENLFEWLLSMSEETNILYRLGYRPVKTPDGANIKFEKIGETPRAETIAPEPVIAPEPAPRGIEAEVRPEPRLEAETAENKTEGEIRKEKEAKFAKQIGLRVNAPGKKFDFVSKKLADDLGLRGTKVKLLTDSKKNMEIIDKLIDKDPAWVSSFIGRIKMNYDTPQSDQDQNNWEKDIRSALGLPPVKES